MGLICFICGYLVDPFDKAGNKKTLKWLLGKVCEALNICQEEDWKFLEASEECCSKCYQQLTDIQQTYQQLIVARISLKKYVTNIGQVVVESYERVDQASFRVECENFRHQLRNYLLSDGSDKFVNKIEDASGVKNARRQKQSGIKENAFQTENYEETGNDIEWEDAGDIDLDQDWTNESVEVINQTTSGAGRKRRKIVVIAEEDNSSGIEVVTAKNLQFNRSRINKNCNRLKKKYSALEKKRKLALNAPKLPQTINGVFNCTEPECSYTSKFARNFERHKNSHLPLDQRPDTTTCEHCGLKMVQDSLRRHVLQVHRPDLKEQGPACPTCGKKFLASDNYGYKAHLQTHQTEKPFVCEECGKCYASEVNLKQHTQAVHQTLNLMCTMCGKQFNKIYPLRHHWKKCHPGVPFGTKSDSLQPQGTCRPEPPTPKDSVILLCTHAGCEYSSKDGGNFRRHMKTHLPKEERPDSVVCTVCGITLIKDGLPRHMRSHAGSGQPTVKKSGPCLPCSHEGCSYSTQDKNNLKRHERSHVPIEERPDVTICPDCGIKIVKESLRKHIRLCHQPLDNVPVRVCPVCGKKFMESHKYRFEAHLKTHEGTRSFFCEECGKGFVTAHNLSSHKKTVHQEETSLYTCLICSKEFVKKSSYKSHWQKHHKDQQPFPLITGKRQWTTSAFYGDQLEAERAAKKMLPERKYPCDQCDLVCSQKWTLVRHKKRIHLKELSGPRSAKQRKIKEESQNEIVTSHWILGS